MSEKLPNAPSTEKAITIIDKSSSLPEINAALKSFAVALDTNPDNKFILKAIQIMEGLKTHRIKKLWKIKDTQKKEENVSIPRQVIENMVLAKKAISLNLTKKRERFPFPGLTSAVYNKLKKEELELEAEFGKSFSDFVTPLSEILQEFKDKGMEIYLGEDAKNPVIIPAGNPDAKSNSLFLGHLKIPNDINNELKALIIADRLIRSLQDKLQKTSSK